MSENEINIQEKLKTYFDLCNDIKKLEEVKEVIRRELEMHLKNSGIDSVKTSVGSITYVESIRDSFNKEFILSVLTDEQKKEAITQKESRYIKITPVRGKNNFREKSEE